MLFRLDEEVSTDPELRIVVCHDSDPVGDIPEKALGKILMGDIRRECHRQDLNR